MPLSALIPDRHAPVWDSLLAWLAKTSAILGFGATTTVAALKDAYLAVHRHQRIDLEIHLCDIEFIVRRLLVAAALAFRLALPPAAKPATTDAPPAAAPYQVRPPIRAANAADEAAVSPPPAFAVVLPRQRDDGSQAMTEDEAAENFARRYMAIASVLADPDAAIRALVQRFVRDPRQAARDVSHWDDDTRGDVSSSRFNNEMNAIHDMVKDELLGFRIHVKPG